MSPGIITSPSFLYQVRTRPGEFSSVIAGIFMETIVGGCDKKVGFEGERNVRFTICWGMVVGFGDVFVTFCRVFDRVDDPILESMTD